MMCYFGILLWVFRLGTLFQFYVHKLYIGTPCTPAHLAPGQWLISLFQDIFPGTFFAPFIFHITFRDGCFRILFPALASETGLYFPPIHPALSPSKSSDPGSQDVLVASTLSDSQDCSWLNTCMGYFGIDTAPRQLGPSLGFRHSASLTN